MTQPGRWPAMAAMAGVDLPVFSGAPSRRRTHHLGVVLRDAPMVIWSDTQRLDWTEDERAALGARSRGPARRDAGLLPRRPEGGAASTFFLGLWEYHGLVQEPAWPLPEDPLYPEVVLRADDDGPRPRCVRRASPVDRRRRLLHQDHGESPPRRSCRPDGFIRQDCRGSESWSPPAPLICSPDM